MNTDLTKNCDLTTLGEFNEEERAIGEHIVYGNTGHSNMHLEPQLFRGLKQDYLNPGAQGQHGQHSKTSSQKIYIH
jgi:hypothetical protein